MQSIPMYTKAGSRLPATPTAEVGRVDLRTPAVMVSPEKIGVLVPGAPVAGDTLTLNYSRTINYYVCVASGSAARSLALASSST